MRDDSPLVGIARRGWRAPKSIDQQEIEADAASVIFVTGCSKCKQAAAGTLGQNKQWFTEHDCAPTGDAS